LEAFQKSKSRTSSMVAAFTGCASLSSPRGQAAEPTSVNNCGESGRTAAVAHAEASAAAALETTAGAAQAQIRPDQVAFHELFRELVETNTTLSSGSSTLAAERMAVQLKAAGFADTQLTLFATPEHPKEGGLVAVSQAPRTPRGRSSSSRTPTWSRRGGRIGSATHSR
jgi:hypothetical protein